MPEADRENDFELIYRDMSQKHGPAVNIRRPFTMDLVYPVRELVPFIGRPPRYHGQKRQKQKSDIRVSNSPNKNELDLGPDISVYESVVADSFASKRKELSASAITIRSKSTGPYKKFQARRSITNADKSYGSTERRSEQSLNIYTHKNFVSKKLIRRKKNGDGIVE